MHAHKLDSLDETERFLETQKLLRLTQEEIVRLSRPVASKRIKLIIENFPTKKNKLSEALLLYFAKYLKN